MEYVEGQSLDQALYQSTSAIDIEKTTSYLFQIAQALLFVHEQGLIHRDLKPSNIFLTPDDKIKLLDFGIARLEQANFNLTTTAEALGTPYYMSPEQSSKEPLDLRTDIYSFGIMAYELLTKERPYQSSSQFDLYIKHAAGEIPSAKDTNPNIPPWLDGMIKTCMQKDKQRRYQSMLEVVAVILENSPLLGEDESLREKLNSIDKKVAVTRHKKNSDADHEECFFRSVKRIATVFVMVMLFLMAWYSPIGTYSNVTLLRTLFSLRGELAPPKEVVIVSLDDLTYQHFGVSTRKPFPRKYIAAALQKIHETKPKLVIIDARAQKENDDELGDSALEAAIGSGPTTLMKWELKNTSLSEDQQGPENTLKYYNDPRFTKVALAEIDPSVPSSNGVVMNVGLDNKNGKIYKNINEKIPVKFALTRAGLSNLAEPDNNEYINFYGKPNRITSISLYKIISGNYNFKDKIVLMGQKSLSRTDVPGDYDVLSTSGSWTDYFGVEIQATIVANLLENNFIKRFPETFENLLLALISGFMFLFLLSKRPSQAIRFFTEALIGWFAVTAWVFLHYKFLIPGVSLMFISSFIVSAGIWFFYGNTKEKTLTKAENMTKIKFNDD